LGDTLRYKKPLSKILGVVIRSSEFGKKLVHWGKVRAFKEKGFAVCPEEGKISLSDEWERADL